MCDAACIATQSEIFIFMQVAGEIHGGIKEKF